MRKACSRPSFRYQKPYIENLILSLQTTNATISCALLHKLPPSAESLDLFVETDLKVRLPFSGCLSGGANQAVTRTPAHNQLTCDYAGKDLSRHLACMLLAITSLKSQTISASQIARAVQQP